MHKIGLKKEYGGIEVEAVFIMPIAILSTILLLYLSLFMFQKANLQAGLETALIYYKNTITDAHVTQNTKVSYVKTDTSSLASGNSYKANEPLNPYRGIFALGMADEMENEEAFQKYFKSIAGNMLFDNEPKITVEFKNYVLLKQMTVTVTQTLEAPIKFSILGVDNKLVISATSRVNIVDHDDMIRNVDFAIDIVEDTKFGELVKNFGAKLVEYYGKFKTMLKIEE